MMQRNIKESGFTLIELLVTVAIVVLLAAIAIPQFSEYKKRAYNTHGVALLRSIIQLQELYYIDNEVFFSIDADEMPFTGEGHLALRGMYWDEPLYLKTDGRESWAGCVAHGKGNHFYFFQSSPDFSSSSLPDNVIIPISRTASSIPSQCAIVLSEL